MLLSRLLRTLWFYPRLLVPMKVPLKLAELWKPIVSAVQLWPVNYRRRLPRLQKLCVYGLLRISSMAGIGWPGPLLLLGLSLAGSAQQSGTMSLLWAGTLIGYTPVSGPFLSLGWAPN